MCLAVPPASSLQWFEDLGGFEKAENIQHFVSWAIKAVELFGSRITYWATFNEPTVSMHANNGPYLLSNGDLRRGMVMCEVDNELYT